MSGWAHGMGRLHLDEWHGLPRGFRAAVPRSPFIWSEGTHLPRCQFMSVNIELWSLQALYVLVRSSSIAAIIDSILEALHVSVPIL